MKIAGSEITPFKRYLNRRKFIKGVAAISTPSIFTNNVQAKHQNNADNSIENASDGSQELRGNKFRADQESTESYDEQNQDTENELAGSENKNNSGSNGKIPEDIPFDDNDDVLAQQIKNAALKERDPEKQKKIWNEYRKYKNLPLED